MFINKLAILFFSIIWSSISASAQVKQFEARGFLQTKIDTKDKAVFVYSKDVAAGDGLTVKGCYIFKNKVIKSYFAGSYHMYDRHLNIELSLKTYDTLGKIIESKSFKENQSKSNGKQNYYLANYYKRGVTNIALQAHSKSKYAKRLIKLIDHFCQKSD